MIRIYPDQARIDQAAAEEIVRCLADAIAVRGRGTLVLSGGSTPRSLYRLLAEEPYRTAIDWERVDFFFGDERMVPPDHPDSNFRMVKEAMLSRLAVSSDRVHRIATERGDADSAAGDYEAEIARIFGVPLGGAPPSFDLVLLGVGKDGHIASLFPRSGALEETERWVVANRIPDRDAMRVTMTAPIFNAAGKRIFLVSGREKAAALAEILEGAANPNRLPAQLILPESKGSIWLIDSQAAAGLSISVLKG